MPSRGPKATTEEKEILRLLAEQDAIPVDQLARFFDLYVSDMCRIVEVLGIFGWVRVKEIFNGQPPWVWLRQPGARQSEMGFVAREPTVSRLAHTRAINEARLAVTKRVPNGRWVCARALRRAQGCQGNLPDAVLLVGDARHAIKVVLTPEETLRQRRLVFEHIFGYDAVFYFCSAQVLSEFKRIEKETSSPNLLVSELPGQLEREAKAIGERREGIGPRVSSCLELASGLVPIVDLLAEYGALPLDQLARFLGCKLGKVKRVAKYLYEEELVDREQFRVSEPDWLWLTARGGRFFSTENSTSAPKSGGLPRRRALNEIRLHFKENIPAARWVSGRSVRGLPLVVKDSLPAALVEVGEKRRAIEVCMNDVRRAAIERTIVRRSADYDVVEFFCASAAYGPLKRIEASGRWPNLIVRRIPGLAAGLAPVAQFGSLEAVGPEEIAARLRKAVEAGQLLPSRARSLAGYALLVDAAIPQGASRTVFALKRECEELGLLRPREKDYFAHRSNPLGVSADALVDRLRVEVEADRLLPSRARSLAGFLLLGALGVSQGARRTEYELERECRVQGLSASFSNFPVRP